MSLNNQNLTILILLMNTEESLQQTMINNSTWNERISVWILHWSLLCMRSIAKSTSAPNNMYLVGHMIRDSFNCYITEDDWEMCHLIRIAMLLHILQLFENILSIFQISQTMFDQSTNRLSAKARSSIFRVSFNEISKLHFLCFFSSLNKFQNMKFV